MVYWAIATAALLLSFERLTYYWISNNPQSWLRLCEQPLLARLRRQPTELVQWLFYLFKLIQFAVFYGWCVIFSGEWMPLPTAPTLVLALGVIILVLGMVLNFGVFYRLGSTGVFYGKQLGHDELPWVRGFPFSVMRHPQYYGTLMSIWAFFLIMRFPEWDWILLPLLETAYYTIGSRYEP
ncbi:MAG: hypothetical protein CMN28_00440 [Salinisphaeraceae bacterium]|nr:hypothetical protein [Salinisphaeraceae bacterium]